MDILLRRIMLAQTLLSLVVLNIIVDMWNHSHFFSV